MDYEQVSMNKKLECMKHVLVREMGYSNQHLMDGLFLAGGDTMIVLWVRSIHMLCKVAILMEDFKFMLLRLAS